MRLSTETTPATFPMHHRGSCSEGSCGYCKAQSLPCASADTCHHHSVESVQCDGFVCVVRRRKSRCIHSRPSNCPRRSSPPRSLALTHHRCLSMLVSRRESSRILFLLLLLACQSGGLASAGLRHSPRCKLPIRPSLLPGNSPHRIGTLRRLGALSRRQGRVDRRPEGIAGPGDASAVVQVHKSGRKHPSHSKQILDSQYVPVRRTWFPSAEQRDLQSRLRKASLQKMQVA